LVIDLFPPARHDPEGINGLIWEYLNAERWQAPTDRQLNCASYCAKSHDDSRDLLLLQFLQEFVYYKDVERLLWRVQEVHIGRNAIGFVLRARAAGVPLNAATQM
jgi:hypothetical protein